MISVISPCSFRIYLRPRARLVHVNFGQTFVIDLFLGIDADAGQLNFGLAEVVVLRIEIFSFLCVRGLDVAVKYSPEGQEKQFSVVFIQKVRTFVHLLNHGVVLRSLLSGYYSPSADRITRLFGVHGFFGIQP